MTGFNSDPPLRNFTKILQKNPGVEKRAEVLADIVFPLCLNICNLRKKYLLAYIMGFHNILLIITARNQDIYSCVTEGKTSESSELRFKFVNKSNNPQHSSPRCYHSATKLQTSSLLQTKLQFMPS